MYTHGTIRFVTTTWKQHCYFKRKVMTILPFGLYKECQPCLTGQFKNGTMSKKKVTYLKIYNPNKECVPFVLICPT